MEATLFLCYSPADKAKQVAIEAKIEGKLKKRMDERFSWSFLGAMLALLGILIAVLTFYWSFRESRPDIVYEIESQSDVFDLHRPLKDLTLSFRGQDVQQQNLNLRIFSVRVWNRGSKDILQDQYDQADPWGIRVQPGQVIEVRVGENNSEYLASHINPQIASGDAITLSKTILEHDRFVTLDVLVLHHRDTPPKISAFGKLPVWNTSVCWMHRVNGESPPFGIESCQELWLST